MARNAFCAWNASESARGMRCREITQLQVACGRRKADGDPTGGVALGKWGDRAQYGNIEAVVEGV